MSSKARGEFKEHQTEFYTSKVLDLELSRRARAFQLEETVWDHELKRIFELVNRHIETLENRESRSRDDRRSPGSRRDDPHLSLAIFGTYGSGKSSLLRTLMALARKRDPKAGFLPDEGKIYSLPVIEPRLDSDKDRFLYAFLAHALEEDLEKHREREGVFGTRSPTLSRVQQAFEAVSEYLKVVDDPSDQPDQDPLGLSLERLDRHTSDFRLREALRKLIDELVDTLTQGRPDSVLLLPVDDADMSFRGLISSLEAYRRYLMHPRLIPIFTFTGRLAEELLESDFYEKLRHSVIKASGPDLERKPRSHGRGEPLGITEHLAVQYLVKLFPIRNRIRIGPAPARVQVARLKSPDGRQKEEWVLHLLSDASALLFGRSEYYTTNSSPPESPSEPAHDPRNQPHIALALRPATLRRQIQVIDAMRGGLPSERPVRDTKSPYRDALEDWFSLTSFEKAAWSLLNVHRDVLREYGLHIEDLYSWTPLSLRTEILRILMRLDISVRQVLIRRWLYRLEDRRGQVLSLLAAASFRPRSAREEAHGDDPRVTAKIVQDEIAEPSPPRDSPVEDGKGLDAATAGLWFLNVCLCFYLPLLLSRNQPGDRQEKRPEQGPISGVGWSLRGSPIQSAFELVDSPYRWRAGMVLLDVRDFSDHLERSGGALLAAWSVWGYRKGKPFAVLSLWRVLGLLGRLLHHQDEGDHEIGTALEEHIRDGSRPGTYGEREEPIIFHVPSVGGYPEFLSAVREWIDRIRSSPGPINAKDLGAFLHTLHGEWMIGEFFKQIGELPFTPGPPPFEEETPGFHSAKAAMENWQGTVGRIGAFPESFWKASPLFPDTSPFGDLKTAERSEHEPFELVRLDGASELKVKIDEHVSSNTSPPIEDEAE